MDKTIEAALPDYEAITSEQIRMWSAGPVRRRLRHFENPDDWRSVDNTLWDQRIFGPKKDWECACAQFQGQAYARMRCPVCGVVVTLSRARKFRFGHINLPIPIPHPFVADTEPLDVIPIIPAAYWDDNKDGRLVQAYEEALRNSLVDPSTDELTGCYGTIIALLEELYTNISRHDEEESHIIARGMALKPRAMTEEELGEVYDWGELRLAEDWQPSDGEKQ